METLVIENQKTASDKVISILHGTNDGNELAPSDLSLLEAIINGGEEVLTELGKQRFDKVYADVMDGKYVKPWFCGVEHLTQDGEGYVYWKGKQIEHYSYRDYEKKKAAAEQLAKVCMQMEASGKEFNTKGYFAQLEENEENEERTPLEAAIRKAAKSICKTFDIKGSTDVGYTSSIIRGKMEEGMANVGSTAWIMEAAKRIGACYGNARGKEEFIADVITKELMEVSNGK